MKTLKFHIRIYDEESRIVSDTLLKSFKDGNGETVETSETISYAYDENNQLSTAENSSSKWEYSYDDRGNIVSKKKYSVNVDSENQKSYNETKNDVYTYDETWKDKLTSYNGQTISYDASGNPTNYLGHNLSWTMGRQLASFDGITYTYNEDGIRTAKVSNGFTTKYYLNGLNIIYQTNGIDDLYFFYDGKDNIVGFKYNDDNYFYVKNQQGDITDITNSNGEVVASYTYDPWGKVLSVKGDETIGNLNPFRYRSYYYDSNIKMYYLQSRYYDPNIGRFINCDDVHYIGIAQTELSYNPFAYCENDPVNYSDPTGNIAISAAAATLGVSVSTLVASALMLMVLVDLATGGRVILSFSEAIVMIVESVYDNIQFNKHNKKTKIPSKLKNGDKAKTPDTHPGEFQKNKDGTYTHKKSKWTFKKDRSNHYGGPHWDASPPNGKEGDYHNIGLDGRILT